MFSGYVILAVGDVMTLFRHSVAGQGGIPRDDRGERGERGRGAGRRGLEIVILPTRVRIPLLTLLCLNVKGVVQSLFLNWKPHYQYECVLVPFLLFLWVSSAILICYAGVGRHFDGLLFFLLPF